MKSSYTIVNVFLTWKIIRFSSEARISIKKIIGGIIASSICGNFVPS